MRARTPLLTVAVLILAAASLFVLVPARGSTRLELIEEATGRSIFSKLLPEGEPVVLSWQNSLFGLVVTEEFEARNGRLTQVKITFADPLGLPPPEVTPADVEDLYHTGGPFTASGLDIPIARVVYRISERGNPRMTIGEKVVDFKREVGFGGAVILTATPPRWFENPLR